VESGIIDIKIRRR